MAENHLDPDAESDAGAGDLVAASPGDMLDGRAAELAAEVGALLRRARVSQQPKGHGQEDAPDGDWPSLPGMEAY